MQSWLLRALVVTIHAVRPVPSSVAMLTVWWYPLPVQILKYECGTANVLARMLPDACGGHASPYHEHMDLACENTTAVGSTHSPLLAGEVVAAARAP